MEFHKGHVLDAYHSETDCPASVTPYENTFAFNE